MDDEIEILTAVLSLVLTAALAELSAHLYQGDRVRSSRKKLWKYHRDSASTYRLRHKPLVKTKSTAAMAGHKILFTTLWQHVLPHITKHLMLMLSWILRNGDGSMGCPAFPLTQAVERARSATRNVKTDTIPPAARLKHKVNYK